MVRNHRPERDPEGFQRVRTAYEVLTEHAGGVGQVFGPAATSSPSRPPSSDAPSEPATEPDPGPTSEAGEPRPPSGGDTLLEAEPDRFAFDMEAWRRRGGVPLGWFEGLDERDPGLLHRELMDDGGLLRDAVVDVVLGRRDPVELRPLVVLFAASELVYRERPEAAWKAVLGALDRIEAELLGDEMLTDELHIVVLGLVHGGLLDDAHALLARVERLEDSLGLGLKGEPDPVLRRAARELVALRDDVLEAALSACAWGVLTGETYSALPLLAQASRRPEIEALICERAPTVTLIFGVAFQRMGSPTDALIDPNTGQRPEFGPYTPGDRRSPRRPSTSEGFSVGRGIAWVLGVVVLVLLVANIVTRCTADTPYVPYRPPAKPAEDSSRTGAGAPVPQDPVLQVEMYKIPRLPDFSAAPGPLVPPAERWCRILEPRDGPAAARCFEAAGIQKQVERGDCEGARERVRELAAVAPFRDERLGGWTVRPRNEAPPDPLVAWLVPYVHARCGASP